MKMKYEVSKDEYNFIVNGYKKHRCLSCPYVDFYNKHSECDDCPFIDEFNYLINNYEQREILDLAREYYLNTTAYEKEIENLLLRADRIKKEIFLFKCQFKDRFIINKGE